MELVHFCREATRLVAERELTSEEVAQIVSICLAPEVSEEDKAALLSAWTDRMETAAELVAFARAVQEFIPEPFELYDLWHGKPLLDCSGTGGGALPLFNVSTALLFVLGALGVPVIKHGNRAMTKTSGSADVLEHLGIRIDLRPGEWTQCLEKVGVTFVFAPVRLKAFAAIQPVRRRLAAQGRRTIFNLLGPLLNPAVPRARLVGVFNSDFLGLYALALELIGCQKYTVVMGQDAQSEKMVGEASAHGLTGIRSSQLKNSDGTDYLIMHRSSSSGQQLSALMVAGPAESARRLEEIFTGKDKGLGREMVLVNTALAAWTQGTVSSLEEGLTRGAEAIDSGGALDVLRRWQEFSRNLPD